MEVPSEHTEVLGAAMEQQFTAERLRESRGWFMVMVGFVVLVFALLISPTHRGFLFYAIGAVAVLFGSFGVLEIRPVRFLRRKIAVDLETGEVEEVTGTLTERVHKGGKGIAGKYYWLVSGRRVRVPPALFASVEEGAELTVERSIHSKTVLEIRLADPPAPIQPDPR